MPCQGGGPLPPLLPRPCLHVLPVSLGGCRHGGESTGQAPGQCGNPWVLTVPPLRFWASAARGTDDFPHPNPGLTQLRPGCPADGRGCGGWWDPAPSRAGAGARCSACPVLLCPSSPPAQMLWGGCLGGPCGLLGLGEVVAKSLSSSGSPRPLPSLPCGTGSVSQKVHWEEWLELVTPKPWRDVPQQRWQPLLAERGSVPGDPQIPKRDAPAGDLLVPPLSARSQHN